MVGCATYYQKTQKFQDLVQGGQLEKAEKLLNKDKKAADGKNRFLYFVNDGWINWISKDYNKSNTMFQDADIYVEDYKKSNGHGSPNTYLQSNGQALPARGFWKGFLLIILKP